MKKRAFICGLVNFPRGGASSNYVQYFALALRKIGYEVIIVTNINSEYGELTDYREILLDNIIVPQNKFLKRVFYKCLIGRVFVNKLTKFQLTKNDLVILYTHHSLLADAVLRYSQKCGAKVGISLVEFFAANDFPKGEFDRRYLEEQKLYQIAKEKCDFIFPISTFIQNYFSSCREKTFCLPILADTSEYPYIKKQNDRVKRFVYPANGRMKDGLQYMLEAIMEVLATTQDAVEFHFCGISEDKVIKVVGEEWFRAECNNRIFIHKWMKYDDLIGLYQRMDFLLIAREDCQMTQANFPSKVPELMTFGVIPIASNVGDYTRFYLHDQENCILMNGYSKAIIVDAVCKAIRMNWDTVAEMSAKARKLVEMKFDYSVWSDSIQIFLDSI